jgi:ornithine carbamoyltransferase
MKKRDLISISDFSRSEIWDLLLLSMKLKKQKFTTDLKGKSVGLIFQKPSTRTAVSVDGGRRDALRHHRGRGASQRLRRAHARALL